MDRIRLSRYGFTRIVASILLGVSFSASVLASGYLDRPTISGYLSAGFTITDNETIYIGYDDNIEFSKDSRLGLQVDAAINKKIRLSSQVLAYDTGQDYELDPEWAYIAYSMDSHLEFRAGRLRIPHYLYSETINVGVSYPWIRPPAEVYQIIHTSRHQGFDVTYNFDWRGNTLYIQPYYGQVRDAVDWQDVSVNTDTEDFYGFQFRLEAPDFEFMLSYLHTDITLDINIKAINLQRTREFDTDVVTAGIRYQKKNWEITSEYTHTDSEGSNETDPRAYYVSVARLMDAWTPYVMLAIKDDRIVETVDLRDVTDNRTITFGVRYDLDPGASIALEISRGEALNDTAGLFGELGGISVLPEDPKVNMLSFRFDTVF